MVWNQSKKKHRELIEKETELGFEVEPLESRQMLAGNVDVIVRGDNLIINGDSDDSHIMIVSQVDTIGVLGIHNTTVTGDVFDLTVADLNNLTINMKGGNDIVMVGPRITAAGKVRMTGGAGDDHLIFRGTVQDRVQIIGGGGNDLFRVFSGTFNNKVTLNGGGGNDSINVSGTFNDKVIVNGGGGDDSTNISAATFATDVKANMGHGNDTVIFDGGSFADARFNFGSGNDVLIIFEPTAITITGELVLNGGGGFDYSSPDPDTIALFPNWTIQSFENTF